MFNRYFLLLWISEFILIFLIALTVAAGRFYLSGYPISAYDPFLVKTLIMALTYMVVFYYFDLYEAFYYKPDRQMFMKLIEAIATASIILFTLYYLFPSIKAWRGILFANTVLLPLGLVAWRKVFTRKFTVDIPANRVLILGSGELAKKIGAEIYSKSEHGFKLVGFIDDDPTKLGTSIVNPGVIGCFGDIARLARSEKIDRIIVALPDRRAKLPMLALLDCKMRGVTVEEGATFQERVTGQIPLDQLKPSWMVFSDGFKSLSTRKIMKRVLDATISVAGLVALSPLLAVSALLIKLTSKGPVLFKQARIGEDGKIFNIYKFRSMRADAESKTGPVWAQADDNRITAVGAFMRKTHIDELPQLINVIKGDMSFVGPRPERPFFVEQLKKVIPYYEMRTVIKPGITGWAQIKYPYGANIDDAIEKLQYDIFYIKNMSPLLDLIIIFMTIKVVLTARGAR